MKEKLLQALITLTFFPITIILRKVFLKEKRKETLPFNCTFYILKPKIFQAVI